VSRGCVPKSWEDLSGLVHLLPGLVPFSLPSPSGTPQGEDGPPSFGSPALSPPRTGALHRPTSDRIPRLPKGRRLHLHAPLPKIFGPPGHLPTPPRSPPQNLLALRDDPLDLPLPQQPSGPPLPRTPPSPRPTDAPPQDTRPPPAPAPDTTSGQTPHSRLPRPR
jgi:hypothetical protein